MTVGLTINDLPTDRASCATCTNNDIFCERRKKQYPGGHVRNSVTGETGGIIACCVNYEGKFKHQ